MRILSFAGALLAIAVPAVFPVNAQAAIGDKAGIAAAVRGDVQLVSVGTPGSVGRNMASGDPIFLGDRITSGPNSGLQILLMDETVFTIGPDSALVIDEFVYDPSDDSGRMSATVLKGAFRFISGRIAAKNPKAIEIKTPVATLGIRGTSVVGWTDARRSEFILTGVGASNNTGDRASRILVTAAGVTREVFRVGFGVTVDGVGAAPTPPARVPAARIEGLHKNLTTPAARPVPQQRAGVQPGGGTSNRGGGLASGRGVLRQSGQGRAGALASLNGVKRVAAGRRAADEGIQTIAQIAPKLSEITRVGQLMSVPSGTVKFALTGIQLTGAGAGSYKIDLSIDFGARRVVAAINGNYELGCSPPSCSSPTSFSFNDTYNYAGDAPITLAQESFSSVLEPGKFTCGGGTCTDVIAVRLRLRNNVSTGEIAKFADSSVTVKAPGVGGDAISGGATGVLK